MGRWWKIQIANLAMQLKHFQVGSKYYTPITALGIFISIATCEPLYSLIAFAYICGHGDGWETCQWYQKGLRWWFNNKLLDSLLDKQAERVLSIILLCLYWYDVIWGILK